MSKLFLAATAALLLLAGGAVAARAADGALDDPTVDRTQDPPSFDAPASTPVVRIRPTRFGREIARQMDVPLDRVEAMEKEGFGRTEMISFISISRKSETSWDDLLKARKKGATLRSLAEKAGLDYNALFRESSKAKAGIDARLADLPPEVVITTAPLTSGATSQPSRK